LLNCFKFGLISLVFHAATPSSSIRVTV